MSKYIAGNQKHLTPEDRIYIENELNKATSFKDIARFLYKDPATISKEAKAHRLSDWYHTGTFYNAKNFCTHRYHCRKTNAYGKIILCSVKCSSCPIQVQMHVANAATLANPSCDILAGLIHSPTNQFTTLHQLVFLFQQ